MSNTNLWSNRDWSPRSGMAVTGGAVAFVGKKLSASAELVALQVSDGSLRWTAALDRPGDAGVAVIATDDALYVADDQTVESFGLDGKKRWLARAVAPGTVDGIYALTPPVLAGKQLVYAGKLWSRLIAIDPATGNVLWHAAADGHDQPQALTVRGDAVISYGYDDVVASNLADGKQRWRVALAGALGPAMVPLRDSVRLAPDLGEAVLAVDGHALVSLSIATGAENWRHAGSGALSFAATAAVIVVADGKTTAGLDPKTGAVRWSNTDGGRAVAPIDTTAVLSVGNDARALAWSDGHTLGSAATTAGPDLRIVWARDGRVVFGDATRTTVAKLDAGVLTLGDASDRAGSQAIEAAADGAQLVVRYASDTVAAAR